MKLHPYPDYRDSGVYWIGNIPSPWKVSKLKYLCSIQTGGKDTVNAVEDGEFPFFVRSQIIERINSFTADCEAVLTAGDGVGVGKVFHYFIGKFDYHQRFYMLNNFRLTRGNFVFYFLKSNFYKVALEGAAKSTVDSLRLPLFQNFEFSVPPIEEQKAIATFLDHETARIDTLIEKQQRLIALLKEKRQAVISHAVTEGLDPTAPMKESGVEWLGEVPWHWKFIRARFLFNKKERAVSPDDEIITTYRDGQVCLRSKRRAEGYTFAVLEHGYQKILPGDLVIHGMDAFAGAIGVSEDEGKSTPEYVVLSARQRNVSNEYFAHILRIMALRNYIYVICPSVRERAPRFRFPKLQDVFLPVPPLDEQSCAVKHIEQSHELIDKVISKADKQISLLQERRTALISAAVTGKIDIRNHPYAQTVADSEK
ncbi:MAG: restriction endonuclease subunit S [Chromatiales bacterium]|nr:restriction endonuclease subunit S [Gammaproteobacteria bacterium]